MREDMYKVIVERPRRGGGFRSERPAPIDLEESPKQEGLRRRHRSRKWLNENLRPLERYLETQIGRPWDKVFSEICAGIDRRNTVQQHIHQHLGDFVAMRVHVEDGVLYEDRGWGGRLHPLESTWASRFYVDPNNGLLRLNKGKIEARREFRRKRRSEMQSFDGQWREDCRNVDAENQLRRIDGIWYRIELAAVPADQDEAERTIDVLRRLPVAQCPSFRDSKKIPSNLSMYGHSEVYARGKRQLSVRELRQYGLKNENESTSAR